MSVVPEMAPTMARLVYSLLRFFLDFYESSDF
jgi:hypothetical protein